MGHRADVKWSYRVATIAGIQVRIHLTFLLLLAFYAWIDYTRWRCAGSKSQGSSLPF